MGEEEGEGDKRVWPWPSLFVMTCRPCRPLTLPHPSACGRRFPIPLLHPRRLRRFARLGSSRLDRRYGWGLRGNTRDAPIPAFACLISACRAQPLRRSSLELSMRQHQGLRTSLAFIGSRSPNLIIDPRLWTKDRSWAVATVVHCQSFVRIASLMKTFDFCLGCS